MTKLGMTSRLKRRPFIGFLCLTTAASVYLTFPLPGHMLPRRLQLIGRTALFGLGGRHAYFADVSDIYSTWSAEVRDAEGVTLRSFEPNYFAREFARSSFLSARGGRQRFFSEACKVMGPYLGRKPGEKVFILLQHWRLQSLQDFKPQSIPPSSRILTSC